MTIDGGTRVAVKGPKGQLDYDIVGGVTVTREADTLLVERERHRAATARCTVFSAR